MAAPISVAEYEGPAWNTTTTPKTTSATTAAGDRLVVVGAIEGNAAGLQTPTGNSVTFTQAEEINAANYCRAYAWTATDSAGGTGWTLSVARISATLKWGFTALRFSGSDGFGAAEQANTTGAPSLSITTTQANSALVVIVADWNATDGTSRTWRTVNGTTPTVGNGFEVVYARDAAAYTVYVAYYPDAGAAGPKTVGLSAPSGQRYAIAAVEVLGSASAPATIPPARPAQVFPRELGEVPWLQPPRRDLGITATQPEAAVPMGVPMWPARRDDSTSGRGQRRAGSIPTTALLEGPLLGGVDDLVRHRAWWTDRRTAPVQRSGTVPDPAPALADPLAAGGQARWIAANTAATHEDRRLAPQQRTYPAPPDPVVTVGTGALAAWWSEDPAGAFVGNRPRTCGPGLLAPPAGTPADPTLPPRTPWAVPPALTAWLQRPQRAEQSGAPQTPDPVPPGTPWTARTAATHADRRRTVPARPAAAAADPVVAIGTGQLAAWWADDPVPAWTAATGRRPADPSLLAPPAGTPADPLLAAWLPRAVAAGIAATHADRRRSPAQRAAVAVPDPLLAVGTGRLAAWWSDDPAGAFLANRRTATLPPDDSTLVGTGGLVAWWGVDPDPAHTAALAYPRRADQSSPAAPPDLADPVLQARLPRLVAGLVAATHADRRLAPVQRDHPDPVQLLAALLEGVLLGSVDDLARHRSWWTDRRLVPAQRTGTVPDPVPADPLAAAWLPRWLVVNRAATHADRRRVSLYRIALADQSSPPPQFVYGAGAVAVGQAATGGFGIATTAPGSVSIGTSAKGG